MTTEQESREAIRHNNLSAIYSQIEALCTDLNGHLEPSMQEGQTELRQSIRWKRHAKAGEQL